MGPHGLNKITINIGNGMVRLCMYDNHKNLSIVSILFVNVLREFSAPCRQEIGSRKLSEAKRNHQWVLMALGVMLGRSHRLRLPNMVFNGQPVSRLAFQSTSTPKRPFPRLPVPSLHHTLEQYLRSIDPFLDDTSLTGHKIKSDAVCERQAWLQDFETGVGARCQEGLLGELCSQKFVPLLTAVFHG